MCNIYVFPKIDMIELYLLRKEAFSFVMYSEKVILVLVLDISITVTVPVLVL